MKQLLVTNLYYSVLTFYSKLANLICCHITTEAIAMLNKRDRDSNQRSTSVAAATKLSATSFAFILISVYASFLGEEMRVGQLQFSGSEII